MYVRLQVRAGMKFSGLYVRYWPAQKEARRFRRDEFAEVGGDKAFDIFEFFGDVSAAT